MVAPSKNSPPPPDKEELAKRIAAVTIVRSGASLNVPNVATINSANLQPSTHLQTWVKVKVGSKTLHFASGKVRTMSRRILRTIHPGLNLNNIRKGVGAPRKAMDDLCQLIADERKEAVKRADKAALTKRAVSLQQRRDLKRKADLRKAAVKAIKDALRGHASDMTLDELTSIWNECIVANIMEK